MKTLLAATAAAALIATSASAQDTPNWYARGDAGTSFASHSDGAGWTVSGAVGRDFGNGFRSEGEVLYLDSASHSHAAETSAVAGFANLYYDFNRHAAWQPFVGAGVGVADVMVGGGDDTRKHGEDTAFAYQATVGLAHPFNDRLTGEVAYRAWPA